MSRATGGAPLSSENAGRVGHQRTQHRKPSLIDAPRQSLSIKLLHATIKARKDHIAATPTHHPVCRNHPIQIVALYQSSIGLPVAMDSPATAMFRMVIAEGRNLIKQRDAIEKHAHAALGENADYQRLRQIPGIGPIHAMTILAEAGDLRRFRHHRQFLKFCGLDLATHQSGQFRGLTKLSKFGNARLRRTFWMAAQVAIRQRDNSFRAKFERYIAKDRDNADLRRKALTAVTAKMARTAHAVIKSGTDYRPFIEGPMPSGRTSIRMGREGASATL
ncbi:MAG: IS110 family transposase [Acidihalobacter sp.]